VTGDRLLIVNPGARAVDDELLERLRREFPDYRVVYFPPEPGFAGHLPAGSLVIACGGDGTVGSVARALAGTDTPFGILARGTFNNFARALGLPTGLDEAIDVVKTGSLRPVTIGRVNGRDFMEAAAVGFFGETIALGEAARDLHYGEFIERLQEVAVSGRFEFTVSGDVALEGRAVSIIVANTPSIGALLPIADADPHDPYIELVIDRGQSRLSMVGQFLAALVRQRPPRTLETHRIRQIEIGTARPMSVHADATDAGLTPARIESWPGGLNVILPT
jgi:diacylglycerol kinase family enzyme